MSFFTHVMPWVSVIALIPAGVLLILSKRIQRQSLSDRAAHQLLYGLLVIIAFLMFVMYALEHRILMVFMGDGMYLFGAPLLAVLVAIACLQMVNMRTLWNRRTVLILFLYLVALVTFNIWYIQRATSYGTDTGLFVMLTIVGGGLTIALVWQLTYRRLLWLSMVTGVWRLQSFADISSFQPSIRFTDRYLMRNQVDPEVIPLIQKCYTQEVAEKLGHNRRSGRAGIETALKSVDEEEARASRLFAVVKNHRGRLDNLWAEWQDRRRALRESLEAVGLHIISKLGVLFGRLDAGSQKGLLREIVERVMVDSKVI